MGENPRCVMVQLANDHDIIKGMYRSFKDPSISEEQRQRVIWEMIRALCIHLYASEEVVCPVIGGEISPRMKDHTLDVDESLKLILSDIDSMKVGQDGLTAKVQQLMEVFFEHMTEEEHLMSQLRDALGSERLLEMGDRFKAAKDHVPTRPHPSAPNNILVHIATAPFDYIRDKFRGI